MQPTVFTDKLRLGKSSTYPITTADELSAQVDNLLRRYLAREERINADLAFLVDDNVRLVCDVNQADSVDYMQTNELVFPRRTTMTLKDFANAINRTSITANRVDSVDYLTMQLAMSKHRKTVCYYVVYSDVDKRFRDIVAICINHETLAYLSTL